MAFKYHVFACFQKRPDGHPRGCCASKGAHPLWERLGVAVQDKNLPDVRVNYAGCLGACDQGPLMVVYPQGVWYSVKTEADIDEIVASHLVGGTVVERLKLDL